MPPSFRFLLGLLYLATQVARFILTTPLLILINQPGLSYNRRRAYLLCHVLMRQSSVKEQKSFARKLGTLHIQYYISMDMDVCACILCINVPILRQGKKPPPPPFTGKLGVSQTCYEPLQTPTNESQWLRCIDRVIRV